MMKPFNRSKMFQSLSILIFVAFFMLLMNIWMPLHRDDFDYSLIWGTTQHMESFMDVLQSLKNHYFLHGGRMVAFFWLDLFLLGQKLWFDIANAAVFTMMVLLLYFHAIRQVSFGKEPGILALTAFLMWLCLPHFGEVAVWKCGAAVYLWTGLIVALFLLPYNLFLAGRLRWGHGMAIPMALLGVLAGWSVENLAVTVVTVTGLISCYAYKKGNLTAWMPAGMLGAFLGFVGILAAPGNYVRYGEQSGGKGILIHIGNQFAGNGEMALYLLPVILLLLIIWRVLKMEILRQKGMAFYKGHLSFSFGQGLVLAFIALLMVSYFTGGWLAGGLRDFLIQYVLVPLHQTRPKTIGLFTNVMSGFEEMVIYLLGIFFLYSLVKQALGIDKEAIRLLGREVKAKDVWRAFPEVRYAGALFAMAFFNNFVMIAAPTFPVRATFSSVCMILVGTLALLREANVQEILTTGRVANILRGGMLLAGLFTAGAALTISYTLTQENDRRIDYIASRAGSGDIITLPPIQLKNRALRHVFFVDFDNGVTKGGLCKYYGVKDIQVSKN